MSFAICPILDYDVDDLTALPTTVTDGRAIVTVAGDRVLTAGAEVVNVYDLNGRCVISAKGQQAIELGSLPSGVYIVRAQTGKQVQTLKVIK